MLHGPLGGLPFQELAEAFVRHKSLRVFSCGGCTHWTFLIRLVPVPRYRVVAVPAFEEAGDWLGRVILASYL